MKKHVKHLGALLVCFSFLFASCNQELSNNSAEKLIKETDLFQTTPTVSLQTGYYKLSRAKDTLKLQALERDTVIRYSLDRQIEGSRYYSYYVYYVSVDLTDYSKKTYLVEKDANGLCHLRSHNNSLIKAEKVHFIPANNEASCIYSYSYMNVTPFGNILGGISEGEVQNSKARFTKYVDEGWLINE